MSLENLLSGTPVNLLPSSSSSALLPFESLRRRGDSLYGPYPNAHPHFVEPYFLSPNKRGVFYEYEEPEAIEKYYPDNFYKPLSDEKEDHESKLPESSEVEDEVDRRVGISSGFITPARVSLVVTLLLVPLGLGVFYYVFILNGPTPVVKARLNDLFEELMKLLGVGSYFSRAFPSGSSIERLLLLPGSVMED